MSPRRAAGVKQQIVKIPQHEAGVAFGGPQPLVAIAVDHEQDPAIDQQAQQRDARKAALATQLLHRPWYGQARDGRRNVGIAKPKQRTGARGFEHHVGAAPPQVGEAGEHERAIAGELRHARRVIAHLRLDHDEVRASWCAGEAVFQQPDMCQASDERVDLLLAAFSVRTEFVQTQSRSQIGGQRDDVGAELSERDYLAPRRKPRGIPSGPSSRVTVATLGLSRAKSDAGRLGLARA